jgi:hypothetical protein
LALGVITEETVDSGGSFVGRFGDQEYELGTTKAGLARAIGRMSQLRREMGVKAA